MRIPVVALTHVRVIIVICVGAWVHAWVHVCACMHEMTNIGYKSRCPWPAW